MRTRYRAADLFAGARRSMRWPGGLHSWRDLSQVRYWSLCCGSGGDGFLRRKDWWFVMAMTAGCFGSGHSLLQYRVDELTRQFGEVSGRTIGLRNGVGYRQIGEFFLFLSARQALCDIGHSSVETTG